MKAMEFWILLILCGSALTARVGAEKKPQRNKLPEGRGLAAKHPGDRGIEKDPQVLFSFYGIGPARPFAACFNLLMSSFTILSMACMTRCDLAESLQLSPCRSAHPRLSRDGEEREWACRPVCY